MDETKWLVQSDLLTPAAREVLRLSPQPAYASLVPSAGNASARASLEQLSAAGAVEGAKDADAEACCQSALWLWHDFLEESHTISQSVETPEGLWWHGIMHRREGDFSNAKYWMRRVGPHPLYGSLAAGLHDVLRETAADKRILAVAGPRGFDPLAFVDLCEAGHNAPGSELASSAVAMQQFEWRVLFDACVRRCVGAAAGTGL